MPATATKKRYASIGRIEAEVFNLARIQEWAGLRFQDKLAKILEEAAAKVESALEDAERDKAGNFRITALNQARVLNIASDLGRILEEAGYQDLVREHLAVYGPMFEQARKIWEGTGIPFSFDQADIDHLQAIADADATYFGRLPSLGVAAVERALTSSVLVGANFQTAAKAIEEALVDAGSPLARHAFTYANDSIQNFSAAMAAVRDQKHKPDFYYYAGVIIKTSRDFCIDRAGKVWPAQMVKEWEKLDWRGKKPGPILVARGGWNCKHQLVACSKAWALSQGLEVQEEQAPEPEPPRRKKPPGLAGADYLPDAVRDAILQTWKGPVRGRIEPPLTLIKPMPAPRQDLPAPAKPAELPKDPQKAYEMAQRLVAEHAAKQDEPRHFRDYQRVRKWGLRTDFAKQEAIRLHTQLLEAKVRLYESRDQDGKLRMRREAIADMLKVEKTRQYRVTHADLVDTHIGRTEKALRFIPYRLLEDLRRNGLKIKFQVNTGIGRDGKRAFYKDGSCVLPHYAPDDIIAHEVAHAIDSLMSGGCSRFAPSHGYWKDSVLNFYSDAKQATRYRKWYDKLHTGRQGTYTNGDGQYWIGQWIDDYEGRIYEGRCVGTEWWSMNVQRYHDYYHAADARGRSMWEDTVRRRYPELATFIEKFFLKPGEL